MGGFEAVGRAIEWLAVELASPGLLGIGSWGVGLLLVWSGAMKVHRPALAAFAMADLGVLRRPIPRAGLLAGGLEIAVGCCRAPRCPGGLPHAGRVPLRPLHVPDRTGRARSARGGVLLLRRRPAGRLAVRLRTSGGADRPRRDPRRRRAPIRCGLPLVGTSRAPGGGALSARDRFAALGGAQARTGQQPARRRFRAAPAEGRRRGRGSVVT